MHSSEQVTAHTEEIEYEPLDREKALGEQVFSVSETQAEAMVESHRVSNDLRRKSVSVVTRRVVGHSRTLSAAVST